MDDRRPTFPLHELCEPIGSDAAPIAANVQHSAELAAPGREPIEQLSAGLERESSQIVYCGSDQQVSEGFAIALRAMGVDANFLPWGIALAAKSPNREDN